MRICKPTIHQSNKNVALYMNQKSKKAISRKNVYTCVWDLCCVCVPLISVAIENKPTIRSKVGVEKFQHVISTDHHIHHHLLALL